MTENILNIRRATREGMRFLIDLYGMSESGKTRSALRLAAGLEPDPTKRLLLDTEGGKRGLIYVDQIPGGYFYAELTAPYTPARYSRAIEEAEAAGFTVVVIDSGSHVWFAEGGVLEMSETGGNQNGLSKWFKPKAALGRMLGKMRSADMDIIICHRAKQPLIEGFDDNGKKTLRPGTVVAIQEKGVKYDMTIVGYMHDRGRFTVDGPMGKCPDTMRGIFDNSDYMTEAMGEKLRLWRGGATFKAVERRSLETAATEAAQGGVEAFRSYWKTLPDADKATLKPQVGNYQSIAQAADDEKTRQSEQPEDRAADMATSRPAPTIGSPFGLRPLNAPEPESMTLAELAKSDHPVAIENRDSWPTGKAKTPPTEKPTQPEPKTQTPAEQTAPPDAVKPETPATPASEPERHPAAPVSLPTPEPEKTLPVEPPAEEIEHVVIDRHGKIKGRYKKVGMNAQKALQAEIAACESQDDIETVLNENPDLIDLLPEGCRANLDNTVIAKRAELMVAKPKAEPAPAPVHSPGTIVLVQTPSGSADWEGWVNEICRAIDLCRSSDEINALLRDNTNIFLRCQEQAEDWAMVVDTAIQDAKTKFRAA